MAALAQRNMKDRKVIVNRKNLILTLESNRDKHIRKYHEAVAGYQDMAEERLKEALEKAEKYLRKNYEKALERVREIDPDNLPDSDNFVLVNGQSLELKVPRNYSEVYDAAIAMARWDTRDTLELTYAEFNCFVRDRWDWKDEFNEVSKTYVR